MRVSIDRSFGLLQDLQHARPACGRLGTSVGIAPCELQVERHRKAEGKPDQLPQEHPDGAVQRLRHDRKERVQIQRCHAHADVALEERASASSVC